MVENRMFPTRRSFLCASAGAAVSACISSRSFAADKAEDEKVRSLQIAMLSGSAEYHSRSEEHTSELQAHRDLHSFPTRRSSDLSPAKSESEVRGGWWRIGCSQPDEAFCAPAPGRRFQRASHREALPQTRQRTRRFVRSRSRCCRDRPSIIRDRKSTRLNSRHTEIYTLSLHDALPICRRRKVNRRFGVDGGESDVPNPTKLFVRQRRGGGFSVHLIEKLCRRQGRGREGSFAPDRDAVGIGRVSFEIGRAHV